VQVQAVAGQWPVSGRSVLVVAGGCCPPALAITCAITMAYAVIRPRYALSMHLKALETLALWMTGRHRRRWLVD